jgi:sugar lactone lactonase YvrE
MKIAVESVVASQDVLGECTVWCDRNHVLWWVDIRGPSLERYNPASGEFSLLCRGDRRFGLTRSGRG